MTYYTADNRKNLIKKTKSTAVFAAVVDFVCVIIITVLLLVRERIGNTASQIAVTIFFAFACCFALVCVQIIAENKRITRHFDQMTSDGKKIECTFDSEADTITKERLLFRQTYFIVDGEKLRFLVYAKAPVARFEKGQPVTLSVVGNVVKEVL